MTVMKVSHHRWGLGAAGAVGGERCCLRPQVKWCCGKVHPAHRHHLAMEPATPDASEPVRWGERDTARSRRTRRATFSVPDDVFFISCQGEGWWLQEWGSADSVGYPSELAWKCKAIEANVIAHTNECNATTQWTVLLIRRKNLWGIISSAHFVIL